MRNYIFLTPELGNMGGAQMFTSNKVAYLTKRGWNVQVFYYKIGGEIKLTELKKYETNYIKDFRFSFYYVPKWRVKKIACFILDKIDRDDEIVIESHLIELAYWGEALAKLINGRHICNFLEEQVEPLSERKAKYFEYKLTHWELMNSSVASLKRLFKMFYKSEYERFANTVRFVCSNVVSKIPLSFDLARADYTILTIGRLDKPYVMPMTEQVCQFIEKYKEKSFNVVYIGGSPDGSLERLIPERYKHLSNVCIYMMGYTFPVPETILEKSDVGIACANSVMVTADKNIPTICIDMNDYYAIGVYGYTTKKKFMRGDEPQYMVSQLLEEVLIDKRYPPSQCPDSAMVDEDEIELAKQITYLEKSYINRDYFDVYSLESWKTVFIANLKWYLLKVINY